MLRHRNEYPVEGTIPAFDGATTWLNSQPLTPEDVAGRVVLASFGTYTCINWIRSLPYVRAWAHKYAEKGLVVIGIQTPEFEFEGELDNIERAIKEMDVRYPVVVDNDPDGVEAAADWASLGSAENYVGYGRAYGFASPGGAVPDERHVYSVPAQLRRNQWALSGDWRIGLVPARVNEPGGSVSYQF